MSLDKRIHRIAIVGTGVIGASWTIKRETVVVRKKRRLR